MVALQPTARRTVTRPWRQQRQLVTAALTAEQRKRPRQGMVVRLPLVVLRAMQGPGQAKVQDRLPRREATWRPKRQCVLNSSTWLNSTACSQEPCRPWLQQGLTALRGTGAQLPQKLLGQGATRTGLAGRATPTLGGAQIRPIAQETETGIGTGTGIEAETATAATEAENATGAETAIAVIVDAGTEEDIARDETAGRQFFSSLVACVDLLTTIVSFILSFVQSIFAY